jgi:hypothetical protein
MLETSNPSIETSAESDGSVRIVVCVALALIGTAMSAWAYWFNGPAGPILAWGILPGAPIVLMAVLALSSTIPLRVIVGASVAGILELSIPYGMVWYESLNYNGGGANIGLGLLLLATPILLPLAMSIGGVLAWFSFPGPLKTASHSGNPHRRS